MAVALHLQQPQGVHAATTGVGATQKAHRTAVWQRRWHPTAAAPPASGSSSGRAAQRWRGSTTRAAAAASSGALDTQRADSDLSSALSLSNIRNTLIRLEDTIIFGLIERAQFALNPAVYEPDAVPVPGFRNDGRRYSLLEYALRDIEQVHGRIRRYTSPDEHAFFPEELPPLVLPPITYSQVLAPGSEAININDKILAMYLEHLLPEMCAPGDDGNYGSSAMDDVNVLQALSKRIHYGKFVAEAKFRQYTAEYTRLIQAQDADGIMALLTDRAVELKVIERVKLKAATFGQDLSSDPSSTAAGSSSGGSSGGNGGGGSYKVRPEVVADLYERWVMPLTKEVEVDYLLRRLDWR